jgi:uncharacterized membrane protein
MLIKYNQALPSGAERVMSLAEQESQHRRDLETALVRAHVRDATRGYWAAILIVAAFLCLGVWCLATNRSLAGIVAMMVPLAYLAGTFINRFRTNVQADQEREGKP